MHSGDNLFVSLDPSIRSFFAKENWSYFFLSPVYGNHLLCLHEIICCGVYSKCIGVTTQIMKLFEHKFFCKSYQKMTKLALARKEISTHTHSYKHTSNSFVS